MATITPASDTRPYHENFEFHKRRLQEICQVIEPAGVRLGIGFYGAEYLRKNRTYQFIHDLDALTLLLNMVALPSIGLVLDLWDIVVSGGSLESVRKLPAEQIVAVQVADLAAAANNGDIDEKSRLLPGVEGGRIDSAGLLAYLHSAGYDGPITPRPSRGIFQSRRRDLAVKQAGEAMERLWKTAGLPPNGASSPPRLRWITTSISVDAYNVAGTLRVPSANAAGAGYPCAVGSPFFADGTRDPRGCPVCYFMFHWDNGLKLTTADLAIDFRRRQPRGFISHAHSDHMARHEYALCTPETAALYQLRMGPRLTLALPCRQPIDWAGLRLTTYPAGHCLGSAMLLAEDDGRTLLYTGDFKLRPSLTAAVAELPHADTLVIESTYGHPDYRLPPREESIAEFLALVRRTLAEERTPVIQGYVLGKSQEVTRILTDAGIPVLQHGSIYEVSRVYEQLGCPLGRYELFRGQIEPGWAMMLPPAGRDSPHLCAAPFGPFRQMGTIPFFPARPLRPDRLGHGPRRQVSPRRRSCDPAFRPCRL